MAKFIMFFFFFCILSLSTTQFGIGAINRILLPSPVVGPESLAFNPVGSGLYTGVSDGRVLRLIDPKLVFVDFAVASPFRPQRLCDGSSNPVLEPSCGRPLGLGFNNATGDLYIADAYFGLVVVGLQGGIATRLATTAEGVPFRFLNAVDIDQGTGIVYFTDASARFQRRNAMAIILTGDRTGRLLKYDPNTRQETVLVRGIAFATGAAVSKDGSFVVVSEASTGKILRYWVNGPKANTSEVFAQLPGSPDNIKRNTNGEFWVAVNIGKEELNKLRPESVQDNETITTAQPTPLAVSSAIRLSIEGEFLQVLVINDGAILTQSISEVQEFQGSLYIGSLALSYVGVYEA